MNDELENLLNSIGLTGSEAKLYLTNLALGPTSAINLGKKIGVTRQRIYVLISELESKGLIKKVAVGSRHYYQTLDPAVLLDRAKKITEQIEKNIPVLKSRQAAFGVLPIVSVYENPIAMREWYRHYMAEAKPGEKLLVWSTGKLHSWYEMDREFYEKYLEFSENHGIHTQVLLPGTDQAEEYQKTIARPYTEVRFLAGSWQTEAEKWLWRDQICFLSINANATNMIVIQSQKLAELERYNFNALWCQSENASAKKVGNNGRMAQIQRVTQKILFEREGKILMMRDTKGQWELPGGKIDFGEDMDAALHREIKEEMSLSRGQYEIHEMCGNFKIVKNIPEYGKHYHFLVLVYRGELKVDDFRLSDEHTEYAWLTVPEILELKMVVGYEKFFKNLDTSA